MGGLINGIRRKVIKYGYYDKSNGREVRRETKVLCLLWFFLIIVDRGISF